jgi:nucleotide-binding universal stress UspA family protein
MDKMREWAGHQLVNLTPDEFIGDPAVIRLVKSGSPSDVITDVASELGIDLTILGTHEYGATHQHLLGTTTSRLLSKLPTPILTVRVQ